MNIIPYELLCQIFLYNNIFDIKNYRLINKNIKNIIDKNNLLYKAHYNINDKISNYKYSFFFNNNIKKINIRSISYDLYIKIYISFTKNELHLTSIINNQLLSFHIINNILTITLTFDWMYYRLIYKINLPLFNDKYLFSIDIDNKGCLMSKSRNKINNEILNNTEKTDIVLIDWFIKIINIGLINKINDKIVCQPNINDILYYF